MAAKKKRALYQFKITLRDIDPPIWRRIQVSQDATLGQLHRVLQTVMGWEDCHLHEFRIGRKIYGEPDPDDHRKIIDDTRTRIHAVLQGVGTEIEYVYDLGDYWQHDLLLEAILLPAPDTTYPRCIAGGRSCPPEDVGGSGAYENYLTAMADPGHEEHEDMMGWRGPFAPEAFSVEKVNRELEKKFRPVRKRAIQQPKAVIHGFSPKAEQSMQAISSKPASPPKERIRIEPNDAVSLELNGRERELIEHHTFADEDLTNRLRVVPKPGERPVFRFTLDDLDELAGFIAAEANHAKDKKLQKELDQLCDRIQGTLDGYTDEDD